MSDEPTITSTSGELFELSQILAADVAEMETGYEGTLVYKYYSAERRAFFGRPQIRFTQKAALNDRFELTKRWEEFGSAPTRQLVADYVRRGIERAFSRKERLLEKLMQYLAEHGVAPTPEMRVKAEALLDSPQAKQFIELQKPAALAMIGPAVDHIFGTMAQQSDDILRTMTDGIGIFSVSETPTNEQLWAYYASSGRGFAVAFNAQHPFFSVKQDDGTLVNGLRRVKYTDDKIHDFWSNPHYLFLVKKKRWSFEQEWRMIKVLSQCEEIVDVNNEKIHLCNVVQGMISSIIYGYEYDAAARQEDMRRIKTFDPQIVFRQVAVNHSSGELEIVAL